MMGKARIRNLVIVFGDQLDNKSEAFEGFDSKRDIVWIAENEHETTHVWSHKLRIAFFFSAMRHFRDRLIKKGFQVRYHELSESKRRDRGRNFAEILKADAAELKPERLVSVEAGAWRVSNMLREVASSLDLQLDARPDNHFICSIDEFAEHAAGRKRLLMEYFYREMRKRHGILMKSGRPVGGEWNFDKQNRKAFGQEGPEDVSPPRTVEPDDLTRAVIRMVERRFATHPGKLDHFTVPVTRRQALGLLRDFVQNRLPAFGTWQDAMWAGEPFLYHSRLSAALNLHLIRPAEVIAAAERACNENGVPINSAEGFIRQILGWREYIRGVYWRHMPDYAERNELGHEMDLPGFYWSGETEMRCFRDAMESVLAHGYAHHIQRLMVLGQLALLLGVQPMRFHEWHLAMYLDAIDWVSLPNVLGMSQFADGGIVGTKPYCATGKYISRQSNYCAECPYDPEQVTGEGACPFTTLYWEFLDRHASRLKENTRIGLQLKNLDRKSRSEMRSIRRHAKTLRRKALEGSL